MRALLAPPVPEIASELDGLCHAELGPGPFIDALEAFAARSRAVEHPLLDAIAEGDFADLPGAIRRLLAEYYVYSHRFTRYLSAAMSSLHSPEHRGALVGNSAEEAGHIDPHHAEELVAAGIDPAHVSAPHPELLRRFLAAIGMDRRELLERTPALATSAWIDTIEEIFRHGGQEQAIGALGVGTEGIVRTIYRKLLRGIGRAWPELSRADRAFFDLHAAVDDDHAEVLRTIAISLAQTPEARRGLALGVIRALAARAEFFDCMLAYLRRMDPPRARIATVPGTGGSGTFVDVGNNRDSLEPVPAMRPGPSCLHRGVIAASATEFSAQRGHPVHAVRLPSKAVSMSIGDVEAGGRTSNHRHGYEALTYILTGRGHTIIEGQRFDFTAGDAFYVPAWCWHQHFAAEDGPVRYLTSTNLPLLVAMGQTVIRQEAE